MSNLRFDIIHGMRYLCGMSKRPAVKDRTAPAPQRKATTFRLDPPVQQALLLLQEVLKKPLNRLVNEALQGFIEKRAAEIESDLEQVLARVRAYRRSDPKFEKAITRFVDAEAGLGSNDPVAGHAQPKAGPAQSMVQKLLRG